MSWTRCCRSIASLAVLLLGLSGCGEEPKPLLQVGEKAIPFSVDMLEGEPYRLEDFAGRPMVITFMASWCPCSNNSMPLLQRTVAAHKDDPIVFLLIGIQDSRKKWEKFVQKWNRPCPAGYDKGDRIARAYGVHAPPTTFFIDRQGVVKRAFYGDFSTKPDEYRQWVRELL